MSPGVKGTNVIVILVAIIMIVLETCTPPNYQDEPTVILPTLSPTWFFSSISSSATPTSTQVADPYRKVARQPTSTPQPEMIKKGQRLFYEVGCFYCHGIQAEGAVGPKLARTELSLDLVTQQVFRPVGDMPVFSSTTISESDLAAIYAYLQSLKPIGPRPEIITSRSDSATGEGLYRYFGCFGCHGYQGEGGFGPRLAGTQLSLEELRTQVRNPQNRMPAFGPKRISDEEVAYIYVFLQSTASYNETN